MNTYTDYGGSDELLMANCTGMRIENIGSLTFKTPSKALHLTNVMHVPKLQKNLVSVSQFCKANNVLIEFAAHDFSVKDSVTGMVLMRGTNQSDLYFLNKSNPAQLSEVFHLRLNKDVWHRRLSHPSSNVLNFMLRKFDLSRTTSIISACNACSSNKSCKLPFFQSSLTSTQPLELIFSDIWGSPKLSSIDGYSYYVNFVDHYTHFT